MRDHSLYDANMSLCQYWLIAVVAEVCAEMPIKRWEICEHRKIGLLPSLARELTEHSHTHMGFSPL